MPESGHVELANALVIVVIAGVVIRGLLSRNWG